MTFAIAARHGLRYIAEETFGTTPSTPDMTSCRHTACSLGLAKTTLETDEIRSDRQIGYLLHGQKTVSGDIDFELAYGAFDELLAGALQSDWSSDELVCGTSGSSFTFERAFADIGSYQRFTGCLINRFNLNVRPDQLLRGKFSILGKGMMLASSSLDATPTAAAANDPMDSFSGTLSEGGSAIALIAGLDLTLDNNLEQAFTLGNAEAVEILSGQARITGEITAYFEDTGLMAKFVDRTESSLSFTFTGAGGSLQFDLPRIVYRGAESPVTNGRGPVTLTLPFTALYDDGEATSLKITRTAA